MSELINVLNRNDSLVVSSREVAKNFDKNHQHVLRDVDDLKEGVQNWTDLFIPSNYTHEQNKQEYREYLLTRDGFTLLAMGFTGKKALEWKLRYIEAFNKMEVAIKSKLSPQEIMRIQLNMIDDHEERIDKLENTMTIDYGQQLALRKKVNAVVIEWLGGKKSNAYKEVSKKVFSECNRDIQDYFDVNSRNNIPKLRFEEAIVYVDNWVPKTNTRMMIAGWNDQLFF